MNFKIKFLILIQFIIINISADQLTIKISGQTKAGILNLGIYNNAEAYDQSVQGEERSERGLFRELILTLNLKKVMNLLSICLKELMPLRFLLMQMKI